MGNAGHQPGTDPRANKAAQQTMAQGNIPIRPYDTLEEAEEALEPIEELEGTIRTIQHYLRTKAEKGELDMEHLPAAMAAVIEGTNYISQQRRMVHMLKPQRVTRLS